MFSTSCCVLFLAKKTRFCWHFAGILHSITNTLGLTLTPRHPTTASLSSNGQIYYPSHHTLHLLGCGALQQRCSDPQRHITKSDCRRLSVAKHFAIIR